MKRIILREDQYKRLIKKNLNEQKIVFSNPKDEFDITNQMMQLLIHLEFFIDTIANKFLYIDKVENGIIYIDSAKYTKEEKDLINTEIDKWIVFTDSTRDKRSQDLTYNFGVDSDWDDLYPDDVAVVDNDNNSATDDIDLDNSDVTDDVDFEDDSTTEIDYDPTKKYSRTEYIALVKDNAIKQMKKHKIPASITIAQGIIESGDGNSGLARKGKNHFGIKCHSWTGEKIYLDTGEVNKDGSKRIDKNACFRKYDNISQSFDDHSKFLIDNSRYSSLFELGTTNYKGWAEGLQKAGYATSPTYANLVISIIEKNNLNKFDSNTNSLVVGCTFTSAELKYFDENIKNNEDNLNFRYWVNQDSNRLERVNKKLSDCGLSDPNLSKKGSINDYLRHSFVLIGKDWVNAGKPKRSEDVETEIPKKVVKTNCELTTEEIEFFNKHIKNDEDNLNFRYWVNQDSNRLERVNKKLSDCGLSDPNLSKKGSINDYLRHSFVLIGKDWVNAGKPKRPKEEKVEKEEDNKRDYSKNGRLNLSELTQIMNDTNGRKEYLSKAAAIQFNKMVVDAKKEGIDITMTDAYRPCGKPGEYVKYKNGEIGFTQWVAWDLRKGRNGAPGGGAVAAPPNPSLAADWFATDSNYCTSNHGFGNAIDVPRPGQKWIRKNSEKYGWYWGEAQSEPWHFTFCGEGVVNPPGYCFKSYVKSKKKVETKLPKKTEEPKKSEDAPTIVGNSAYILGKQITVSKNGPKNHASRKLGNWQSDNATDIFGKPGTTVYSITKGTVSKIGGNEKDHTGKIYGGSITVKGKDGYSDIFYTHLQNIKVEIKQEVTLGTPLAEISLWHTNPKGSHVHVGLPYKENLNSLLNLDTGKVK